ncbi:MAG: hypothetical protein IJH77_03150 [Mogibacterium sp.]|nr:hypothetical protein [Mogibacterium sp.]
MPECRITWYCPDMLNLHGDRGNLMALTRIAGIVGLEPKLHRIDDRKDPVPWEETDILFFNPGEVRTVAYLADALGRQREQLRRYVEEDGVLVAIGTSGAAFGNRMRRLSGEEFEGLGILDMECREREGILGDDIVIRIPESGMELSGIQIQLIDAEVAEQAVLGEVLYGYGNQGYEHGCEGARYRNVFYTNLLGPVLVRNPWWGEELIRLAMRRRGIPVPEDLPEDRYALEQKSHACVRSYCLDDYQRTKSHNPWNKTDRHGQ